MTQRGVVAAGHPATAAAGAAALRVGGNAVDAAVAAVLTSFVAEPLLTGLGAGGYLLAAPPGASPVLLDFFVEVPGRGAGAEPAPFVRVWVRFQNATQTFNVGASSCGTYGAPAGLAAAAAPVRPDAAGRAGRAGRPARPRGGPGERDAGVPVRVADRRAGLQPGDGGDLPGRRATAARGRPAARTGVGRRARPVRQRRRRPLLHRGHRPRRSPRGCRPVVGC